MIHTSIMKTILLLGSGENWAGVRDCGTAAGTDRRACDKYAQAGPAMQVADAAGFDMLDGDALAAAVAKHRPDVIVPRSRPSAPNGSTTSNASGHPGRTERPGREFHDEPQGHPRPRREGAGAEDGAVFLRRIARRTGGGCRENRLPLRGQAADVLLRARGSRWSRVPTGWRGPGTTAAKGRAATSAN